MNEVKILINGEEYLNKNFLLKYCDHMSTSMLDFYGYSVDTDKVPILKLIELFKKIINADYNGK
jgi:hypothetical protein